MLQLSEADTAFFPAVHFAPLFTSPSCEGAGSPEKQSASSKERRVIDGRRGNDQRPLPSNPTV